MLKYPNTMVYLDMHSISLQKGDNRGSECCHPELNLVLDIIENIDAPCLFYLVGEAISMEVEF